MLLLRIFFGDDYLVLTIILGDFSRGLLVTIIEKTDILMVVAKIN